MYNQNSLVVMRSAGGQAQSSGSWGRAVLNPAGKSPYALIDTSYASVLLNHLISVFHLVGEILSKCSPSLSVLPPFLTVCCSREGNISTAAQQQQVANFNSVPELWFAPTCVISPCFLHLHPLHLGLVHRWRGKK